MTKVYFVRHAQSDFTWADDETRPLTSEAQIDIVQIENFFLAIDVDQFYSSPYKRAADTIRTVAEQKGKTLALDSRFKERVCGTDGQKRENLVRRWEDFSFCEPEGENLHSVQKRNVEALNEILAKHPGQTLVVGTHGTALSMIINHFNSQFGLNDFLRIIDLMPLIVLFEFDNANLRSITEQFSVKKAYMGKNNLKELLKKKKEEIA